MLEREKEGRKEGAGRMERKINEGRREREKARGERGLTESKGNFKIKTR